MVTKKEIKAIHKGLYIVDDRLISLADSILDRLWDERLTEKGITKKQDRSGSCKFASLLARALFGGRIVGNYGHVYVERDSEIIDLNKNQEDVRVLGAEAYIQFQEAVTNEDFRLSISTCMPRVERWIGVFIFEAKQIGYTAHGKFIEGHNPSL